MTDTATTAELAAASKYEYNTAEDSVREKDWAAGSATITDNPAWYVGADGTMSWRNIPYSPAWYKTIDEPVVNALDHVVRCSNSAHHVTRIDIWFSSEGKVAIINDGPGIEIIRHPVASERHGRDVYVPEFILGMLFQGSNRKKDDLNIIGGTNGIGAKLANLLSTEFRVKTVSAGRSYTQQWRRGMREVDAPVIVATAEHEHTSIVFTPDYAHFGYAPASAEEWSAAVAALADVVRTRAYFAAAYTTAAVYFNGVAVPVRSISDIGRMINGDLIARDVIPLLDRGTKSTPLTWEVAIIERPENSAKEISIINGIVVARGNHTAELSRQIVEGVRAAIAANVGEAAAKIRPSAITGEVCLLVCAKIPNPGWDGQRKDTAVIDKRWTPAPLPKSFIAAVTAALQDRLLDSILSAQNRRRGATAQVDGYPPDKYHRAEQAGKRESARCFLLTVEGDSAMGQIKAGLANSIGFRYHGLLSMGGVIVNARKMVTDVNGRLVLSKTLHENKFLNALREFVGLNTAARYEPGSATYAREMRALKYGGIIACVDQDHDGVGQIFGLLLNLFELFWPALIRAGFVRRFETPRLRAFPRTGGKVLAFYSDEEYEAWAAVHDVSRYRIKYYKGLGTHTREESTAMMRQFADHQFVYTLDPLARESFTIYYGPDANLRKKALAQPPPVPEREGREITCTGHLRYETHLFQRDSILRHLISAVDGMTQGGRMIFHASQRAWAGGAKHEMKVAQLAGYVSEHEAYHHGESSLASAITNKAFIAPGGKQIPQLIPIGNFGTRAGGGSDAAQPRYIYTRLNTAAMSLLYPAADYPLLRFEWDEGRRGAPKFYVPILPTAVLESMHVPGTGWKVETWARDVTAVIAVVRRLIEVGDESAAFFEPPPDRHGWNGTFLSIRGVPYSLGAYEVLDDDPDSFTFRITELPLRRWTSPYLADLIKRRGYGDIVAECADSSSDSAIDIRVTLRPGALAQLEGDDPYTDPIEEWFRLREPMRNHLNLIGSDNEVMKFADYSAIIRYWFRLRRWLYIARVDRDIAVLRMRVRYAEALVRYLRTGPRMRDMTEAEMCAALVADGYPRIWSARVRAPEFMTAVELDAEIFDGPNSTFDWALNITDRARAVENVQREQARLDSFRAELDALVVRAAMGKFRGAQIWLDEIDALAAVIDEGRRTRWQFSDAAKFQY